MSLSAIIVDDEQLARDELAYLLKELDVDVLAQGKNGVEAVNLIKEFSPELVFLDVQMPGLDGFGAIKKLIDKKVPLPQIVFATAYDHYAVQAFEVNAVDYVLKPFDKARIGRAIGRAKKQIEALASPVERLESLLTQIGAPGAGPSAQQAAAAVRPPTKLLLKAQQRMLLVDSADIVYATIEDGLITLNTRDLEGASNYRTIEELHAQLDADLFWRVHRSYLVNIHHIKELVPWFKSSYILRMDDKKQSEVPVSRNQTRRLRELLKL